MKITTVIMENVNISPTTPMIVIVAVMIAMNVMAMIAIIRNANVVAKIAPATQNQKVNAAINLNIRPEIQSKA